LQEADAVVVVAAAVEDPSACLRDEAGSSLGPPEVEAAAAAVGVPK